MYTLEVSGPSEPQLLFGGPSGLLDFVLRVLRPCDPRNNALDSEKSQKITQKYKNITRKSKKGGEIKKNCQEIQKKWWEIQQKS